MNFFKKKKKQKSCVKYKATHEITEDQGCTRRSAVEDPYPIFIFLDFS